MTFDQTPAEAMKRRLREDLKAAMQARRTAEVKLLRVLVAALDNAEAVPTGDDRTGYVVMAFGDPGAEVPRKMLGVDEVRGLLERERAERWTAAAELVAVGQDAAAQAMLDEAELVGRYLDR